MAKRTRLQGRNKGERQVLATYRLTRPRREALILALSDWQKHIKAMRLQHPHMQDRCDLELALIKEIATEIPKAVPYDITPTAQQWTVIASALGMLSRHWSTPTDARFARSFYQHWRKHMYCGYPTAEQTRHATYLTVKQLNKDLDDGLHTFDPSDIPDPIP